DACREVSDIGHDRVYLTDRLGMPLIEPVTEPDMRTPQEVEEVGRIIRRVCRSTGKVRTGYGAARQDVNVSIAGGTRIEIKGVPQLWRIPRLVHSEAMRQCSLLRIRDTLKARGITSDSLRYYTDDVTRIVAKTQYEPMRAALEEGHRVKGVVLKGFAGILNEPTQENTTFAKEFSDRVRVIACLTRLPNMVHSDMASESLYGKDWQAIRKRMKADRNDALILVWGDEADTQTACQEIGIRAKEATVGVPSDTRQALKDGTNGFERVLPGANRMYPDTDLPPLAIPQTRIDQIAANLPGFVWDQEARYLKLGLPEELVEELCLSPRAGLFLRLVDELNVDPTFAAIVLCQRWKAFRRDQLEPDLLAGNEVFEAFKAYVDGRIAREGVVRVLRFLLERRAGTGGEDLSVADAIEMLHLMPVSDDESTTRIGEHIGQVDRRRFATNDRRHEYLMGTLMGEYRGRVDGARLAKRLRKELDVDGVRVSRG
ncbi:MAG: hypothetical protein KJ749_15455, partial [Planctomycetes bacterium]|nr:hypothetical protein [Planctomycetota bacterium]